MRPIGDTALVPASRGDLDTRVLDLREAASVPWWGDSEGQLDGIHIDE